MKLSNNNVFLIVAAMFSIYPIFCILQVSVCFPYIPFSALFKVLNIITEEVLMHDGSFKSVTDQCDYIKQALSSEKSEYGNHIAHTLPGRHYKSFFPFFPFP